jgi:peroxiredoxin
MNKILLTTIFSLIICFSGFSQGSVTINFKNASTLKGTKIYIHVFNGKTNGILDSAAFDGTSPVKLNISGKVLPAMYEVFFGNHVYPIVLTPKDANISFDLDNNNLDKFIVPDVNDENKALSEILDAYMNMNKNIQMASSKYALKSGEDTVTYKKQMLAIDSINVSFAHIASKINNKYKGSYVGDVLCKMMVLKTPKEIFGTISVGLRTNYILEHFFDDWNFKDKRFVYNPFMGEALKYYLNTIYPKENDYDKNPAERLTKAVNIIMSRAYQDSTVEDYTVNYLIDYFLRRGPGEIILFLYDNYLEACTLELNEKTLERIKELYNLKLGHKAPDFSLPNEYGTKISLSSVTGKGTVLLMFWASWCTHCKTEVPKFYEVYNQYKNKGFQVIAVSLDDDKSQWLSFISFNKLGWINVSDLKKFQSEVSRLYFIYNTPTTFLLDKDGNIISKNLRPQELKEHLEKIYK